MKKGNKWYKSHSHEVEVKIEEEKEVSRHIVSYASIMKPA